MGDVRAAVRNARERFSGASPETLLRWGADTFSGRVAISCSFGGPGGIVLIHMAHRLGLSIPVLFIDTGYLFPETYRLKEEVERAFSLPVRTVAPRLSPEEQAEQYGPRLWERDPDLCCSLRKVEPMAKALEGLDCWITSLRRDQSPTRASVEPVELHRLGSGREIVKLNPLAYWTRKDVWRYAAEHRLPYNPLLDQGSLSLGCVQCTARAGDGGERAGRWPGRAKTECGLHTFTERAGSRGSPGPVELGGARPVRDRPADAERWQR